MAFESIRIVIAGVDQFTSTIGKAMKGIKQMGRGVANIGKNLTYGLTLPIALFGAMTLSTAGDFEGAMNRVQNLTDATTSEFMSLNKEARLLGATTAFTAKDAADSMGILGLAGLEVNDILKVTKPALNLAAAGQIELSESTEVLTGIMAGFGKTAKDAVSITDTLVMAMKASKTDIIGVGEAMSFVAPLADAAGLSIKDTAIAIGLLSNVNIKGARAGTVFRAVISSLLSPTAEAVRVLEQLKIPRNEIFDATGKFRSLEAVIKSFAKSGATAAQMNEIFGRKMGIGMLAMVKQVNTKLPILQKRFENLGGTAQRAADVQMKGFNGQLKAMKSAFQELQLAIASSGLLEFASDMLKKVTGLLRKISQINPKILKFGTILAGIVILVGPLLTVLGTLMIVFGVIAAKVAAAGGVIALLSNPIGWIIAGILALIGVFTYLVTNTDSKVSKVIMALNPLAGVMVWIMKRWERFLPFVKLFVWAIVESFKWLWKTLSPVLQPMIDALAWLSDMAFEGLDKALSYLEKLASIALPEWLQKKVGFMDKDSSLDEGMNEKMAMSRQNVNVNNKAVIEFKNAPPGMQAFAKSAGMTLMTDRGEIFGEGN